MKLKYYMRGLGIGIVLTTLILTIGNPKEKLSDQEIKDRAEALGMVMKEENNTELDQALDNIELSVTPSPSQAVTEPSSEPTVEPTLEPTLKPTQVPTPKPTQAPAKAPDKDEAKISFTIKSGMSSGKVAALLVEEGLIEDADDFNRYIVKKGKASNIRVGNYSILADASYDDIITMITTKK